MDEECNQSQEYEENDSSSKTIVSDDSATVPLTDASLLSCPSSQEAIYGVNSPESSLDVFSESVNLNMNNSTSSTETLTSSNIGVSNQPLLDLSQNLDNSRSSSDTLTGSNTAVVPDQRLLPLPQEASSTFSDAAAENAIREADLAANQSLIENMSNMGPYLLRVIDSDSEESIEGQRELVRPPFRSSNRFSYSDNWGSVQNPGNPQSASANLPQLSNSPTQARRNEPGIRPAYSHPSDYRYSSFSSISRLFSSDTASSSTDAEETPRRRTNLVYKAALEENFMEFATTCDPNLLTNNDPPHRLEHECLCDDCLEKIDDQLVNCLDFLFKVLRFKCPRCNHDDRMKEYQMICYACSRIENICFHCGNNPVAKKDLLNFYSLFSTDDDLEFFYSLEQDQKRHIIYQVYREWDTTTNVERKATVKKKFDNVLRNMQLLEA